MQQLEFFESNQSSNELEHDLRWLQGNVRPNYGRFKEKLTSVDLFAGCGGLSLGVSEACFQLDFGMVHKWACETDPDALKVYIANLKPEKISIDPVEQTFAIELASKVTANELALKDSLGPIDLSLIHI